jgi:hypothetical protein
LQVEQLARIKYDAYKLILQQMSTLQFAMSAGPRHSMLWDVSGPCRAIQFFVSIRSLISVMFRLINI